MATKKVSKKKVSERASTESKTTLASVGEVVYIRTVTYHAVGRVIEANDVRIVLEDASWVASSGRRFGDMLKLGFDHSSEYEYVGAPYRIASASIVDCVLWKHPLPTTSQ